MALTKEQKKAGIKMVIQVTPYIGIAALLNHLSSLFNGKPFLTWEGAYKCLLAILSEDL